MTQGREQALAAAPKDRGDTKLWRTLVCTWPGGRNAQQAGRRRLEGGRDLNRRRGAKHHLAENRQSIKTTVYCCVGSGMRGE